MKRFFGILVRIALTLVFFIAFVWCGFAFFYQLPGGRIALVLMLALWCVLAAIVIGGEWRKNPWVTRILACIVFAAFVGWWSTIRPSLVRDWDPALARTVEAKIDGSIAHIINIRDFRWRTPSEGEERWIEGDYDLDTLTGMDIYLSYWMGPLIAHTLVSFKFEDGRELVFSSEIRREKGEEFSAIGGFFKDFELAMLAATPEDIIRLRTDVRKEDVFRYSIKSTPKQARDLLEFYLNTANKLSKKAAFYNTLTANCTTVIFDMARVLDPGIPIDWRILFSGQLPAYLYDHKFVDTTDSLRDMVKGAYISHKDPVPENLLPKQGSL